MPVIVILLIMVGISQIGIVYFFLGGDFYHAAISHVLSAVLLPWPIFGLIAERYTKNKMLLLLFFIWCFFIPLVAGIGLLLSVARASYVLKPSVKNNFTTIDTQDIPTGVIKHIAYVENISSNIRSVLEYSSASEERIRAVLATRKISDQNAIPILQIALKDPVDEVRLLAYSMLNTKEKKLSAAIQTHLNELTSTAALSEMEKAGKYHYVAECYWELSFLGLEQGEAKVHVLKTADYFVAKALKTLIRDAELYFLKARIALELAQYQLAKSNFRLARKFGMPVEKLAPYQAELAFAEKRYAEVQYFMQHAKKSGEKNRLTDMVKQWQ